MKTHELIKKIRLDKNITQEYIANELNMDVTNYGRIERGVSKLTIERLLKIVDILQVDVESLVPEYYSKSKIKQNKTEILLEEIISELKQIKSKIK